MLREELPPPKLPLLRVELLRLPLKLPRVRDELLPPLKLPLVRDELLLLKLPLVRDELLPPLKLPLVRGSCCCH